jgi:nitrogen regulatory protein PII
MVREEDVAELVKGFYLELDIGAMGNGVAVFVPIDGIGGMSAVKYFVGEKEIDKEKEDMIQESKNVLIITVVDKGNTDLVMDAAREAGASGGTVVKAKGTGAEIAKFFGVSISEEKEMVYIVSSRKGRDDIMKAIMEKAGGKTEAHGVVFSLPVDGVIGIREFESL